MKIFDRVDAVYEEAAEIRAYLHSHPELSENEENTARYIASVLDKHGIAYKTGFAGYGIVACVGSGPRGIGLRADMDALPMTEETGAPFASQNPGVMHACGHDVHVTSGLAILIMLKDIEEEITARGYTVKLFFQPAEETVGGAERMIKEGCMKSPKVEKVFGFHVDPNNPIGTFATKAGPMNAAVSDFRMTVKGTTTHGAHPDQGTDSIVCASEIVMAVQTLITRHTAPTTPLIITFGSIHGGEINNIIPAQVELLGTVRALDPGVMFTTKRQLMKMAKGIAQIHGAKVEFDWNFPSFPALINDQAETEIAKKVITKLYGSDAVHLLPEPSMGADDFAFFSNAAKGTFVNIGTGVPGEPFHPLHSEFFLPPQEVLKPAAAVMTGILLETMGIDFE
ncbi:MAG: amidohydrolase [Firmicutes bacterium]|nr:amidohydrolase [Bacillota bacterium]